MLPRGRVSSSSSPPADASAPPRRIDFAASKYYMFLFFRCRLIFFFIIFAAASFRSPALPSTLQRRHISSCRYRRRHHAASLTGRSFAAAEFAALRRHAVSPFRLILPPFPSRRRSSYCHATFDFHAAAAESRFLFRLRRRPRWLPPRFSPAIFDVFTPLQAPVSMPAPPAMFEGFVTISPLPMLPSFFAAAVARRGFFSFLHLRDFAAAICRRALLLALISPPPRRRSRRRRRQRVTAAYVCRLTPGAADAPYAVRRRCRFSLPPMPSVTRRLPAMLPPMLCRCRATIDYY